MKIGKSLIELATELEQIAANKRDFVASTTDIALVADANQPLKLVVKDTEELSLSQYAQGQLTDYVGVPRKYAERMASEAPALLANNVNHWLHDKAEPRMVRAIGTKGRAFLSNRYRRLDNEQIMSATLPLLIEQSRGGNLRILSSEVTESRLYVQAAFPMVQGEVKAGDVVQAGFTLSNSEIGGGSLSVVPFINRLVCLNGLIVPKEIESGRLRRTHLGRALDVEDAREIFKDDTIAADDHALMLKVRDAIMAMSNPELFVALLDEMKRTAQAKIDGDPIVAVDKVIEVYQLPQTSKTGLLTNLLSAGDLTQWGMVNAVTALAHNATDFDSNIELQQIGGRILAERDFAKVLAQPLRRQAA